MSKEERINDDIENMTQIAEGMARGIEGGDDLSRLINTWVMSATMQKPRARFRMMTLALMIGARLSPDRRLELSDKIILAAITFDFEACERELEDLEELAAFDGPNVAEGA